MESDIKTRLEALMKRHQMDRETLAKYLGVPLSTVGNWLNGCRKPGAAVIRLLDVLAIVETLAPGIHDNLIER